MVHCFALIAMFIWGLSYIWSKEVFKFLGPMTTIFFRLIISCLFMLPLLFLFKKTEKINPKHYKLFLSAAFFEPFLYFVFESNGLLLVSPTICSAIIATIPLFAPIFAFLLLKERIKKTNVIGFFISFFGVIVMLFNDKLELSADIRGVLFLFGAVGAAVGYSIALRKLTLLYNPFTIVVSQSIIGAVYFLPMVLFFEGKALQQLTFSFDFFIPLLYLAILASSVAFLLYTHAVSKLGVARSNIYTNMIPVFTAFCSFFILKESITISIIIGIALVIGGLVLSQYNDKQAGLTNKKSDDYE